MFIYLWLATSKKGQSDICVNTLRLHKILCWSSHLLNREKKYIKRKVRIAQADLKRHFTQMSQSPISRVASHMPCSVYRGVDGVGRKYGLRFNLHRLLNGLETFCFNSICVQGNFFIHFIISWRIIEVYCVSLDLECILSFNERNIHEISPMIYFSWYTTDIFRTWMHFLLVNVTFDDAVNMIDDVITTANPFPYNA